MEGNGVVSAFAREVYTKINTGLLSLSVSSATQSSSLSGFPLRQTTCSCLHDTLSCPYRPPFFFLNLYYFPKQPCECLCQHPGRWAAQNRKSSLERAGLFFCLQYWFTVTGEGWPQTDTTGSHFRLLRARPVFHLLSVTPCAPSSHSRTDVPDAAGPPEL